MKFEKDNEHTTNLYTQDEMSKSATIRNFRTVRKGESRRPLFFMKI